MLVLVLVLIGGSPQQITVEVSSKSECSALAGKWAERPQVACAPAV